MKIVELPDGTTIDFPDDTPPDVIESESAKAWGQIQRGTARADMLLRDEGSVMAPKEPLHHAIGRAGFQMLGGGAGAMAGVAAGQVTPGMPADDIVAATKWGAAGSAAAGQVYDRLREMAARYYGDRLPPSAGATTGELLTGAAYDAVADLAAGGVAQPVAKGAKSIVSATTRDLVPSPRVALRGRMPQTDAAQKINDVAMIGGVPTADLVSDNNTLRSVYNYFGNAPGGEPIQAAARANYEAAGDYLEAAAAMMGNPRLSQMEMGGLLKSGARRSLDRIKQKIIGPMFDRAHAFLPDETIVETPNLDAFFKKYEARTDLGKMIGRAVKKYRDAYGRTMAPVGTGVLDAAGNEITRAPAGIPAKDLRDIKSLAGYVYNSKKSDLPEAIQKEMWNAIRADLDQATAAMGPEAEKALGLANAFYKQFKGAENRGVYGIEGVLRDIIETPDSQKAFQLLMRQSKSSAEAFGKEFKLLPRSVQDDFRATSLYQLGRARKGVQDETGEAFSFSTMLSNLAEMKQRAPESFKLLYGAPRHKEAGEAIERLLRVSAWVRNSEKMSNSSRSGYFVVMNNLIRPIAYMLGGGAIMASTGGSLTGVAAGAGMVAAEIGMYRKGARLMTSPAFVRWLADTSSAAARGTEKDIAGQFLKLGLLASYNKELRQDLVDYTQQVGIPIRIEHERITNGAGKNQSPKR